MKYAAVWFLVLIVNTIFIWYATTSMWPALGLWWLLIAIVEGALVGTVLGAGTAAWEAHDTEKRLRR